LATKLAKLARSLDLVEGLKAVSDRLDGNGSFGGSVPEPWRSAFGCA